MSYRTRVSLMTGLIVAVVAGPALAASRTLSFDDATSSGEGRDRGAFAGQLLIGDQGPWSGKIEEDVYFLINRHTAAAVKAIPLPEGEGGGSVAVDVLGQFQGALAGAGLLYGYNPRDESGYAFVLRPSGGYALYRLQQQSVEVVSEGTNKAIHPAAVNRLAVEVGAEGAILMVNGEQVFSQSADADQATAGRFGLVAMGVGAYSFENLTVSAP